MDEFQEDFLYTDECEIVEKRKYIVVVIYDVTDDKRRSRLSKFLKSYGFRVQRSSFEGIIDNRCYNELLNNISKYINADEDLLRIYKLSGNAEIKTWGKIGKTELEDVIII
jgi:CRISPR-associated protein Cas2